MDTRWLSAKQAADYSGFHLETVRDALRAQELQGTQRVKGGNWRTTPAWVDTWIAGDMAAAA